MFLKCFECRYICVLFDLEMIGEMWCVAGMKWLVRCDVWQGWNDWWDVMCGRNEMIGEMWCVAGMKWLVRCDVWQGWNDWWDVMCGRDESQCAWTQGTCRVWTRILLLSFQCWVGDLFFNDVVTADSLEWRGVCHCCVFTYTNTVSLRGIVS